MSDTSDPPREKLLSAFSQLTKRVSGALASVNEVFNDPQLRKKTVELLQKQVGDTLTVVQDGAGMMREDARRGMKQALTAVQMRIQQERRKALMREFKNARVDVQIGSCLYEDAPQELRSILWLALINDPRYRRRQPDAAPKFGPTSPTAPDASFVGYGDSLHLPGNPSASMNSALPGSDAAFTAGPSDAQDRQAGNPASTSGRRPVNIPGKIRKLIRRKDKTASAGPDVYDEAADMMDTLGGLNMDPAEYEARRRAHEAAGHVEDLARRLHVDLKIDPEAPPGGAHRSSGDRRAGVEGGKVGAEAEGRAAIRQGLAAAHAFTHVEDSEEEEEEEEEEDAAASWDLVSPLDGSVPLKAPNLDMSLGLAAAPPAVTPGALLSAAEKPPADAESLSPPPGHALHGRCFEEEGEALARSLWQTMSRVEWPLPSDLPLTDAFTRLLETVEGTEEIDDIIRRDVPRTFPEHPLFNFKRGQEALYHVLKAYSVHDPEVGYCQGMAFIAGLLLMYLPEEPAYQLFCAVLGPGGAGMRAFFLPGLESLQTHMARLDWLQSKHLPLVHRHLQEYGIVPILYASQWFMTAFACPLPPSFACRVLDVMLTERSTAMLVRVALAILMELEPEVLELHDFEQIIEHLKVQPVSWDPETTRRVLNNAVGISLTNEDLEKVDRAIEEEQAAEAAAPVHSDRPAHLSKAVTGSVKEMAAMVFELDNQDFEEAGAGPAEEGAGPSASRAS